jgi:hypothetical protein
MGGEVHVEFWENLIESPLRRSSHRWEDIIKTNLKEMGWVGVDSIHLTRNRALVNTIINLRALQSAGDVSSGWATIYFS